MAQCCGWAKGDSGKGCAKREALVVASNASQTSAAVCLDQELARSKTLFKQQDAAAWCF